MTRPELIRKLLATNHLNVPERGQLVPSAIHLTELLAVVRDTVEQECRFCSLAGTLEKLGDGKYRWTEPLPVPAHAQSVIATSGTSGGKMFMDQNGKLHPSLDYLTDPSGSAPASVTEDYLDLDSALLAFVRHVMNPGWPVGSGSPDTIDGIHISELEALATPQTSGPSRAEEDALPREFLILLTPDHQIGQRVDGPAFQDFVGAALAVIKGYFSRFPPGPGIDLQVACALLPGGSF